MTITPRAHKFVLVATAGLFGAACSSETSPSFNDMTSDSTASTGSSTAQTTAQTTSTATQSSSTSSHTSTAHSSTSTSTSTATSTAASTTQGSSTSAVTTTSVTSTSSDESSSSSESSDSSETSADDTSSGSGSESSTSSGEDSGEGGSSLSAGCGKDPTIASNMYNNGNPISITAADRQRRYILSVPDNYDNTKPYNLVIAWHQLDGNDKQMYDQHYYWLRDIPDAASSTIFVAPNGEKNGQPCTGNSVAEGGCGWPDSNGSNVALADAVVSQVLENFCIDKNRIFANGWSYGGSMSYRTACSRPLGGDDADWGVRAVAVYNGLAQLSSGGCTPSKAVAFYASHGTNDDILNYDQGGISMSNTYAQLNGCNWMTPTKATGNHVCTNISGCMEGYPVEFCSFVGGHTPDPQDGGQRWQPQEVWKFFSELTP